MSNNFPATKRLLYNFLYLYL